MTVPQRWLVLAGGLTGITSGIFVTSLVLPFHIYLIDANISLSSLSVWAWLKWSESKRLNRRRKRTGIWDH